MTWKKIIAHRDKIECDTCDLEMPSVECSTCKGFGEYQTSIEDEGIERGDECDNCEGRGIVVDPEGKGIVQIMTKHGPRLECDHHGYASCQPCQKILRPFLKRNFAMQDLSDYRVDRDPDLYEEALVEDHVENHAHPETGEMSAKFER